MSERLGSVLLVGAAVVGLLAIVASTSRSAAVGAEPAPRGGDVAAGRGSADGPPPIHRTGDPRLVPLPAIAPAPADNPTTPAKAALGKQLFFDPRLSGNNTMSCASCHKPEHRFADTIEWNKGEGGFVLPRNTPSCLNTGFFTSLFWDGRAATLEEQALEPIRSGVEMNQDLDELERELGRVPEYVRRFQEVFGARPNRRDVARALAAYQRTLVTPSPYDRYLRGDDRALSDDARRGLALFVGEAQCIRCHNGPNLSDGRYYRMGVSEEDPGRFKFTGRADDRFRFRTPSLRNVAETAPYMHHGFVVSLDDVLTFYYERHEGGTSYDLPLDAPDLSRRPKSDIKYLAAFLKSLTGSPPDTTPPELPPGR